MKKLSGVIHLRTLQADMNFKGRINPNLLERLAQGISATGGATIGYDIVPREENSLTEFELRISGVVAVNNDNFNRKVGHALVQDNLQTEGRHSVTPLSAISGDSAVNLNEFVHQAGSGEFYLPPTVLDVKRLVVESIIDPTLHSIFGEHPAFNLLRGVEIVNLAGAPLNDGATGTGSLVFALQWLPELFSQPQA